MAQTRTDYADTCAVTNTDHGRTVEAEILNFVPERVLDVSLDRSVKLTMRWQTTQAGGGLYVGNMAGMEFTSSGPEQVTYRLSR